MKPFFVFSLGTFIAVFFLLPSIVSAASLYIDPAISTLNRGDSASLSVRLDTDEVAGECINAVDAVISYSDNIDPVDISIGESIFTIWVERPIINRENRTITFAGGVPNGYCGRVIGDPRLTNVLAKIIFRLPGFTVGGGSSNETEARVSFSDETTAYLNDGQGTKSSLNTYGATLQLNPKAGAALSNSWQDEVSSDVTHPDPFNIELIKGDKEYSGKYYIIFNTTDKQTGIDHYEVMEESLTQFGSFQWGRADAPWIIDQSPYVLKDQSLNSIIRVKAVDKAGNEYIANLIPDESVRTISRNELLTFLAIAGTVLVTIVITVATWLYVRRRKNTSDTEEESEDNEN